MDLTHKVLQWLDYHRWTVIAVLAAVFLAVALVGCEPRTESLTTPGKRVTAYELTREIGASQATFDTRRARLEADASGLNAEIVATNSRIESAQADLEHQVALRQQIVQTVGALGAAVASGGFTAPAAINAVVTLLLGGLAAGAGIDLVRKNRIISGLKAEALAQPLGP
jgi:hypothetical protein